MVAPEQAQVAPVTVASNLTLADLRAGLASRDRQSFDAAFARAATACNGCHRASGHGFIEVPTVPGRSIPATE